MWSPGLFLYASTACLTNLSHGLLAFLWVPSYSRALFYNTDQPVPSHLKSVSGFPLSTLILKCILILVQQSRSSVICRLAASRPHRLSFIPTSHMNPPALTYTKGRAPVRVFVHSPLFLECLSSFLVLLGNSLGENSFQAQAQLIIPCFMPPYSVYSSFVPFSQFLL